MDQYDSPDGPGITRETYPKTPKNRTCSGYGDHPALRVGVVGR